MLMKSDSVVESGVMDSVSVPDPQVAARAKARSFSASFKKQILEQLDGLDREGQAALLRREGLYSTLIRKWRLQAARDGGVSDVVGRRPGPTPDPAARELAKAQREVEALRAQLATSRRINDVQVKLCALLDDLSKGATTPGKPTI